MRRLAVSECVGCQAGVMTQRELARMCSLIRSRRKTPAFMREDTSRAARRQSPFPMLLLLTFYAHSGIFVPVLLHTDHSIRFGRFAVNRSRE